MRMKSAVDWTAKEWQRVAHAALVVAVVSFTSLAFLLFQSIRSTDERLMGTWQSDADRTVAGILENGKVDEKQVEALRNLFGKMRITYASNTLTTELEGRVETCRYVVLGKDQHSVVIREINQQPSVMDDLELSEFIVIHFEGPNSYWLYTQVGGVQEHFKRVQ